MMDGDLLIVYVFGLECDEYEKCKKGRRQHREAGVGCADSKYCLRTHQES